MTSRWLHAAGTAAIGVTYGAHPREQLAALAPLGLAEYRRRGCAHGCWPDELFDICPSATLADGGRGVRFEVMFRSEAGAGIRRAAPRSRASPT